MALRKIVTKSDEVLHKKCKPVEVFDEKLSILLDDMAETQVGILRRVVFIDVGDGPIELVNPEIVKKKGSQRGIEGCLSCPNEWGYVVRPNEVTVKAQDRTGQEIQFKCTEFFARCVCHELDHLDGHLFIEIADEMVDPSELED